MFVSWKKNSVSILLKQNPNDDGDDSYLYLIATQIYKFKAFCNIPWYSF